MSSKPRRKVPLATALSILGVGLPLLAWIGIKAWFGISDRYLPSPLSVWRAAEEIQPSVFLHTLATAARILIGMVLGTVVALAIALTMCRYSAIRRLFLPTVQSLRAVPAVATVPFFLIWFGFSESGKIIMVLLAVALNLLVAADHIIDETPEKYSVALRGLGHSVGEFPVSVALPLIVQRLLPALRTAAATIFGVVVVSELLGAQLGLGYLIQTSYATYSIHVIFMATIILGLLNVMFDAALRWTWGRIYFWNTGDYTRRS